MYGLDPDEARARADDLLDFMEISNWATQYQETNCPDAAAYTSELLRNLARQAGFEKAKEPTFRKLDD